MKLPPHLNALRAFEASARHQSFSAAAAELNVTPAAVGQLVRTLEDWLGTPLFVRVNSGRARLSPTEMAERSEEHTSELQSLMRISYAVFCLKKKTNTD